MSHYGRAMHRAMRKHNLMLWIQAGRPIHRGKGEVSFSLSVYRDAVEALRQQILDHANARTNVKLISGIDLQQPPPLVYVHPRAQ